MAAMRGIGKPGERSPSRLDDPVAADVAEELRFHIEGTVDELVRAGWSEGEARAEAQRRFGDLVRIGDQCKDIGRQREKRWKRRELMHDMMQDVRYAMRSLKRSPSFALIAVLTLGLGIGATTAIFTVVNAVVLRPLPFEDPDRLFLIWERNEIDGVDRDSPSPPNFLDWREAATSFTAMAAWNDGSLTMTGTDRPEVLTAIGATSNFFEVFGVRPILGRTFAEGEDAGGGGRVAVLGYGAWQRIFAASSGVLGQAIILDGQPHEVIGVMPPEFRVPRSNIDVWVPSDYTNQHRQSRYLSVIARLRPGVTETGAEAEMQAIGDRLRVQYPEANHGFTPYLVSVQDQLVGRAGAALVIVFAAVGFVLLLACTNVANLVLGRSAAREAEIAVRASLGAGRGRLRMQFLTENALLGVLGGILGIAIAWGGVGLFLQLAPSALPRIEEVSVDGRVLAFALGTAVMTGLLLGLAPAARAAGARLTDVLREGGLRGTGSRKSELTRRILVISEVALSLVLLIGAGLAVRSLMRLRSVDPGFATQQVYVARVNLGGPAYGAGRPLPESNALKVNYFRDLLERLHAIPGVRSAGVTSTLPLTPAGIDFNLAYHAEGHPLLPEGQAPQTDYRIASPGYFEAMDIPLVRGRTFNDFDRDGSQRVVMLNESLAERLWPGENPIGKRITIYYVNNVDWEVVGMVGDTRHQSLSAAPPAQMFVPLAQAEVLFGYMTVVVRTQGNIAGLVDRMRDAATAIDPNEPLYDFATIETLLAEATELDRVAAFVFGLFAVLALVLSAAGIYGVISYQVARRTREIGVRMALGATRRKVVSGVVGEAAVLASVGVALGLGGAALATRVASGFLYDISARDPLTFVTVSALLLMVAMVAALVPAVRAASIDPLRALRSD
jgi:predicted permease